MKTIDERATEWSENNKNLYGIDAPTLMEASYHQGAADQKAIDDEEYRKDMRYISTKREELIDKACEWLKKELYDKDGFLTISSYWHLPVMIKAFKKYLNNE